MALFSPLSLPRLGPKICIVIYECVGNKRSFTTPLVSFCCKDWAEEHVTGSVMYTYCESTQTLLKLPLPH